MKYAERKINNLVNALNNAPPPPNYPDCTHCDNGKRSGSTRPTWPHQCKTGPNGKCKQCGRWLTQDD